MPFDQPDLQSGDSGDAVTRLQEDLTTVGAFSDSVDGFFGDSTTDAVVAFQEAMDISADGIVGFDTWAALEGPEATEDQQIALDDFPAIALAASQGEEPDMDNYLADLGVAPTDDGNA
jgi:murein L,D-transpeptidase YcbB/YkuD